MREVGIRVEGVEKSFGGTVAIRALDLEVSSGSFFSIIGPSGCGKTTTLRIIAGLESPDKGRVFVGGRDVTRLPAHRRPVNTVFQSYALFPHLNVFENVAFGLREARVPKNEIDERVAELIELVKLTGRERSRPHQLSGGQQQRVALARALINHPRVLLLDEPLGSLDLKLRKEVQLQLTEVQRRVGITFIYVTHDQEEAFSMSDEVAVMNAGVLEQSGTPETVYRHPRTLFVADFVGTANRFSGRIEEVRGDNRYLVHLENDDRIESSGTSELTLGERVCVIVRPEEVRVLDQSQPPVDSEDGFTAEVEHVSYLGPLRHVRLRSNHLGTLLATMGGNTAPVREGERVAVSWSPDSTWVVPDSQVEQRVEDESLLPRDGRRSSGPVVDRSSGRA